MSNRGRPRRIEIAADVAQREAVPDDLNADVVGPYTVPDVARRRRAGLVYLGAAAISALLIATGIPGGMWLTVVGFLVIAAYHLVAGWRLVVDDHEALDLANRWTEYAVGHASAALTFEGVRSRPVWNVLTFSAEDPPRTRSLVRIDAVDGSVLGGYTEAVPVDED